MTYINIGNWDVTDIGIEWVGIPQIPDFVIRYDNLNSIGFGERAGMYDSMIGMIA